MQKKLLSLGMVPVLGAVVPICLAGNAGPSETPRNLPPKYSVPALIAYPAEARERAEARTRRSPREEIEPREFGAPTVRVEDPHDFIENAANLIEYEVRDSQDERLGTFNDLVLDINTGQIEFVAVGPGEPLRLVPPQALQPMPDENRLVLDIDSDRWEQAPSIEREEIDRLALEQEANEIYRYYGLNHRSRIAQAEEQREFGSPAETREQRRAATADRLPGYPATPNAQPRLLAPDLMHGERTGPRPHPQTVPPATAPDDRAIEFGAPAQSRQERRAAAANGLPGYPATPRAQPGMLARDLMHGDRAGPRPHPRALPPGSLPGDPAIARAEPRVLAPDRAQAHQDLRWEQEYGATRERPMTDEEQEEWDAAADREARVREARSGERGAGPTLNNPRFSHSHRGTERTPGGPLVAPEAETEFGAPSERELEEGEGVPEQDRLIWGSDLLGQPAVDADREPVGEITDLIVDLHVGYIQHVIVAFDQPEPQTFAIPVRDIEVADEGQVIVRTNRSALEEAPRFEPRTARLRRFEPFRYDSATAAPQYGDPAREPKKENGKNGAGDEQ